MTPRSDLVDAASRLPRLVGRSEAACGASDIRWRTSGLLSESVPSPLVASPSALTGASQGLRPLARDSWANQRRRQDGPPPDRRPPPRSEERSAADVYIHRDWI